MKSHKFSVEDAENHGVYKALLLEHLKFHQQNNEGMDTYVIDGKVWCHAKRSTMENMYPYMNGRSISRWLQELEDDGIIESRKPKVNRSDHTKYYRVHGYRDPSKSIGQNVHSVKTPQTPISDKNPAQTGSKANGQNDHSNGHSVPSMNGQNDHSSIVNYSEDTIVKGDRSPTFNPGLIEPPQNVEKVKEIGGMKAIPPEACEIYYEMRSVDNFMRMTKDNTWKPILNWHADLKHCYKKGYLKGDKNNGNPQRKKPTFL